VPALAGAARLIREGGVIVIVCYIGHEGGREEAGAVLKWAQDLGPEFVVSAPEDLPEEARPFLIQITKQELGH